MVIGDHLAEVGEDVELGLWGHLHLSELLGWVLRWKLTHLSKLWLHVELVELRLLLELLRGVLLLLWLVRAGNLLEGFSGLFGLEGDDYDAF